MFFFQLLFFTLLDNREIFEHIHLFAGMLLYFCYGIHHSRAGYVYNLLPNEHCGLLPPSPERPPRPSQVFIAETTPSTSGAGYEQVQLQTDDTALLDSH